MGPDTTPTFTGDYYAISGPPIFQQLITSPKHAGILNTFSSKINTIRAWNNGIIRHELVS